MLVITRWYSFLQLNHPMVVPNDFTQNWDPSARWDFMEEHPEEEKKSKKSKKDKVKVATGDAGDANGRKRIGPGGFYRPKPSDQT
jgi:hypothetical protein